MDLNIAMFIREGLDNLGGSIFENISRIYKWSSNIVNIIVASIIMLLNVGKIWHTF